MFTGRKIGKQKREERYLRANEKTPNPPNLKVKI